MKIAHLAPFLVVSVLASTSACRPKPKGGALAQEFISLVQYGLQGRVKALKDTPLLKRLPNSGTPESVTLAETGCVLKAGREYAILGFEKFEATHFVVFSENAGLEDAQGRPCPIREGEVLRSDVEATARLPAFNASGDPSASSQAATFSSWYLANYDSVKQRIGSTHNMCATFATVALDMAGIDFPRLPLVASAVAEMIRRRWDFIKPNEFQRMTELMPGDIVVTQDADTARDGIPNHMMVVTEIVIPGEQVRATDNQGRNYLRRLDGRDGKSPFYAAFRIR